jgi:hypothetical protein
MGHIFNELIVLQKMVGFSLPKHDDHRRERRSAEIAQAFFLFRMAGSKIYEAQTSINSKEIQSSLNSLVYAKAPQIRELLKQVNKAVSGAAWLTRLRNGMGFHYPSFADWKKYTTPTPDWIDDYVYMSSESGNTFFDASASVAMHWMFDEYRDVPASDSIEPLIEEMVTLIRLMVDFTNAAMAEIVSTVLQEAGVVPVGKVLAPANNSVGLPFWIHLKDKRGR